MGKSFIYWRVLAALFPHFFAISITFNLKAAVYLVRLLAIVELYSTCRNVLYFNPCYIIQHIRYISRIPLSVRVVIVLLLRLILRQIRYLRLVWVLPCQIDLWEWPVDTVFADGSRGRNGPIFSPGDTGWEAGCQRTAPLMMTLSQVLQVSLRRAECGETKTQNILVKRDFLKSYTLYIQPFELGTCTCT